VFIAVTAAVAALLVAAKKLWNCAPPGPRFPPNVQSALAANGITSAKLHPRSVAVGNLSHRLLEVRIKELSIYPIPRPKSKINSSLKHLTN
jgi:hypothetical protein